MEKQKEIKLHGQFIQQNENFGSEVRWFLAEILNKQTETLIIAFQEKPLEQK